MAEIATIDNPRRRIEEIQSRQSRSAAYYYGNLFRTLSSQTKFNFSDLLPPSLDGLIQHLRLPRAVGPASAFQECLNSAAESLIGEEGLSFAIDRLAGLPIPISTHIRDSVAALSKEDRRALIKRLLRTPHSPVAKIHLIQLLLPFAEEAPAYLKLSRRICAGLLNAKGEDEFAAFLAILRWADEQFGLLHKGVCSAQLRLAVVWTHSHRIFTILASSGAPIDWIQATFSTMERPVSLDMFERDDDYWFDVAHPRRVDRILFLLAGFSSCLTDDTTVLMDQRLRDLLDSAAISRQTGSPDPALFKNSSQLRNSMGSFLGEDNGEQLSLLMGLDPDNVFTNTSLQTSTEQAVARLMQGKDDIAAWASLIALLGDRPPNRSLVDNLGSIIRQTDFVDLVKKDIQLGILAIHTASQQAVHSGDEALRQRLKSELLRLAELFGHENSGGVTTSTTSSVGLHLSDTFLDLMPDLALNLSLAMGDPENTVTEFLGIMTELVEVWSEVGSRSSHVIQRLCEELPVSHAQKFWPLLVRLRAT